MGAGETGIAVTSVGLPVPAFVLVREDRCRPRRYAAMPWAPIGHISFRASET